MCVPPSLHAFLIHARGSAEQADQLTRLARAQSESEGRRGGEAKEEGVAVLNPLAIVSS